MPGVAGCENKEGVKCSEALQMIRTILALPVTELECNQKVLLGFLVF